MSKYTKLEDAINEMTRLSKEQIERTGYGTAPIEDIVDILANLPTIEIVRCKDCIYNTLNTDGVAESWCYKHGIDIEVDDYCSSGERIDNE